MKPKKLARKENKLFVAVTLNIKTCAPNLLGHCRIWHYLRKTFVRSSPFIFVSLDLLFGLLLPPRPQQQSGNHWICLPNQSNQQPVWRAFFYPRTNSDRGLTLKFLFAGPVDLLCSSQPEQLLPGGIFLPASRSLRRSPHQNRGPSLAISSWAAVFSVAFRRSPWPGLLSTGPVDLFLWIYSGSDNSGVDPWKERAAASKPEKRFWPLAAPKSASNLLLTNLVYIFGPKFLGEEFFQ